jgi:hypothetical protein
MLEMEGLFRFSPNNKMTGSTVYFESDGNIKTGNIKMTIYEKLKMSAQKEKTHKGFDELIESVEIEIRTQKFLLELKDLSDDTRMVINSMIYSCEDLKEDLLRLKQNVLNMQHDVDYLEKTLGNRIVNDAHSKAKFFYTEEKQKEKEK